jgi:hypothetical protein
MPSCHIRVYRPLGPVSFGKLFGGDLFQPLPSLTRCPYAFL